MASTVKNTIANERLMAPHLYTQKNYLELFLSKCSIAYNSLCVQ